METIIFTHGDCDGICSGALALAANRNARIYFSNPISIIEDLGHAVGLKRAIVCDVAINAAYAQPLRKKISTQLKKVEVIYIDHHPLPPRFRASWLVHDKAACASELTYRHFINDLHPDMSRVAMYGAIGDYRDDTPFAKEITGNWDKRSLYYQAGTLSQGIEMRRQDYDYKRDLVRLLSENVPPSEIDSLAKDAILASRLEDELRLRIASVVVRLNNLSYVIDAGGFISKAAIYARVYGGKPVGVAAEFRPGRDSYDISVRATGDYDLNVLVSQAALKYGGTGGGHPQAAGGRIPARYIMDFIEDLDRSIGEYPKKPGRTR